MTRGEFDLAHRELVSRYELDRANVEESNNSQLTQAGLLADLRNRLNRDIRELRHAYRQSRMDIWDVQEAPNGSTWRVLRNDDGEPMRMGGVPVVEDERIRPGDVVAIDESGIRPARAGDQIAGIAAADSAGFDSVISPYILAAAEAVGASQRSNAFERMAEMYFNDIKEMKEKVPTPKKTASEYAKCENGHDLWLEPKQRDFYLARCTADGCDKFLKAGSALEEKSSDGPKKSQKQRAKC